MASVFTHTEVLLWHQPYFLRNLVNTEVFPEWRIEQPFEVLRAVIDLWHRQHVQSARAAEAGGGMTAEQALGRLGLPCGDAAAADAQEIRKAYRKLAIQFHPDKNPEGRAEFEAVQRAYQLLTKTARAHDGKDAAEETRTVELLLKAQAILYQRCGGELAQYRYPCYAMLCSLVEKEMAAGRPAIACAGMEVLALTSAADPGNAQELVLANGLTVLVGVLHRCLAAVDAATGRDDPHLRTCAFACQAAAAVVAEDSGGEQLCLMEGAEGQRVSLLRDVVSALSLRQCPPLVTAALYVCMAAAFRRPLLAQLLEAGALWSLLGSILRFEAGAAVPQGRDLPPHAGSARGGGDARRLRAHLAVPLVLSHEHRCARTARSSL